MPDEFSEYEDAPTDKTPITEDGAPEGEGESIHIPMEFLQGKQFKEGDEIVMKVVSADDEGVEVEYAVKEEPDSGGDGMSANAEIDQAQERY
jgi:hypothetical protein